MNIVRAIAMQLRRQHLWSIRTFGPGQKTASIIAHIRKELAEVEAAPDDVEEWIDVASLAFAGALRVGYSPEMVAQAWIDKQAKNETRQWPDWRTTPVGEPIERLR